MTEKMAMEEFDIFEREAFSKSLVHLRMMINANENGHAVFVRDLMNTLDVNTASAKPMLNMLAHMVTEPIVRLPLAEEVAFFSQFNVEISDDVRDALRNNNLNPTNDGSDNG